MNRNTLIAIAVGVVVLLAAGYMLFFKSDTSAVDAGIPSSPAQAAFVSLTEQLKPVGGDGKLGFNTSVLSDPRFLALVDIHTAILPEASGRKDPFAPLNGVGASAK